MELSVHEDTWPYIDEFFRRVPDAIQKVPSFQEALTESERQGRLHAQQQTLMLVLRHKFGNVPEFVTNVIEGTSNLEQLNQWLEQALDANSLAEVKFD